MLNIPFLIKFFSQETLPLFQLSLKWITFFFPLKYIGPSGENCVLFSVFTFSPLVSGKRYPPAFCSHSFLSQCYFTLSPVSSYFVPSMVPSVPLLPLLSLSLPHPKIKITTTSQTTRIIEEFSVVCISVWLLTASSLSLFSQAFWNYALSRRTGYRICRVQCKMRTQGCLFKIIKNY